MSAEPVHFMQSSVYFSNDDLARVQDVVNLSGLSYFDLFENDLTASFKLDIDLISGANNIEQWRAQFIEHEGYSGGV